MNAREQQKLDLASKIAALAPEESAIEITTANGKALTRVSSVVLLQEICCDWLEIMNDSVPMSLIAEGNERDQ